jgi:hypothetical protein
MEKSFIFMTASVAPRQLFENFLSEQALNLNPRPTRLPRNLDTIPAVLTV